MGERLFITQPTEARCAVCGAQYQLGEEVRLFLTEYGVQQAHETCAASAGFRLVCLKCKKESPEQRLCACGSSQRVVEEQSHWYIKTGVAQKR